MKMIFPIRWYRYASPCLLTPATVLPTQKSVEMRCAISLNASHPNVGLTLEVTVAPPSRRFPVLPSFWVSVVHSLERMLPITEIGSSVGLTVDSGTKYLKFESSTQPS